ncbi:MAG TPA: lytic transglycosylase domain-containing protein, partial [Stellaceae bacterium]|nr:lytic transglycosylase domain-containing protein [Stellaceae bacterium]
MRGGIWASVFVCAGTALWSACAAEAASKAKPQITIETVKQAIEGKTGTVQLVTFPDTGWDAVKIVRGGSPARDKSGQKPATEKTETAEIVTFADPRRSPVRILRGDSERALAVPGQVHPAAMTMQVVTFASLRDRPVNILRGAGLQSATETELFGPASAADLDRVAFAVDGAESSHGADLRMWRPEPGGPQGPMQVSAAAAFDAGGGDRFDLTQNRALGRAYLARMYRRYGNWQDAIAAYNWGPGNLDAWIGGGRAADKLPLAVERYPNRVLREAVLAEPGITTASRWALSAAPSPGPADRPPVPASVAAAFVAD